MAHLCNRYTLIVAVVASIAGAISMLAMIAQLPAVFGGMFGGRAGRDNIVGLLVLAIVVPIAATLVRAAVSRTSRTREFQADATGTHNCSNPLALATALQKLERGSEVLPMRVSEGASRLVIVNPQRGATFASLFPPVRRLKSA